MFIQNTGEQQIPQSATQQSIGITRPVDMKANLMKGALYNITVKGEDPQVTFTKYVKDIGGNGMNYIMNLMHDIKSGSGVDEIKGNEKYMENVPSDVIDYAFEKLAPQISISKGGVEQGEGSTAGFAEDPLVKTAGLGLGVGVALGAGKKILSSMKSPTGTFDVSLPKGEQRLQANLLGDILNISKTDPNIDINSVTKTFAEQYKPVKDFKQLEAQTKELLYGKDPNTAINKRNSLIQSSNTKIDSSYMQNLYDYKKELEANPQTTDIKLKKINEIISKEESWIKSQGKNLDLLSLEKRKEQLGNDLKRFLDKDLSTLGEADFVENQALNKLRAGALSTIEKTVDAAVQGTENVGKIKEYNKTYSDLKNIEYYVERQALDYAKTPAATTFQKVMTKVRNVTKSIPGVSLLTNRLEQYRPTLKQETLDKLSSYMDKISKLAKSEKLAGLVKGGGKVLGLLGMIGAIYEVSGGEGATQAEETTPSIQTQYNQSNTPKIPGTTLSPGKRAIVNPEPQIFKGGTLAKENPMTTYTIPGIGASIGLVDLGLEVLSWTEEKVRKFINSYSKMSAEDKKSIEQELINLTGNK